MLTLAGFAVRHSLATSFERPPEAPLVPLDTSILPVSPLFLLDTKNTGWGWGHSASDRPDRPDPWTTTSHVRARFFNFFQFLSSVPYRRVPYGTVRIFSRSALFSTLTCSTAETQGRFGAPTKSASWSLLTVRCSVSSPAPELPRLSRYCGIPPVSGILANWPYCQVAWERLITWAQSLSQGTGVC
jgi:hypothetical protein